jgi:hypothetical protein
MELGRHGNGGPAMKFVVVFDAAHFQDEVSNLPTRRK